MAAAAASYLLSLTFYPALGLPPRRRLLALGVVGTGVAAAPLLLPVGGPVIRLGVAIFAGVLILKAWDLHVGAERGHRPTWTDVAGWMANPVSLVHRRRAAHPRPTRREVAGVLIRSLLVGGVAWAALVFFAGLDWSGRPFLLEHAAKAGSFVVFAMAFFEALAALVRLAGGSAVSPLDRPWVARTPAGFWRRFNRCVGEFLREDVFRPAGGLRHPVRATLAAFAVSAVLHEYIFTVATGRVQGYQTAFFMLHGGVVALTLRWKPGAVVGIPATLAFHVLTSVLFFASFEGLGGFYSEGLPWWLWGSR